MAKVPKPPQVVRAVAPPTGGRRKRNALGDNEGRANSKKQKYGKLATSSGRTARQTVNRQSKTAKGQNRDEYFSKDEKLNQTAEWQRTNNSISKATKKWVLPLVNWMVGLGVFFGLIMLARYYWRIEHVVIWKDGVRVDGQQLGWSQRIQDELLGEPLLFQNWQKKLESWTEVAEEIKTVKTQKVLPQTLLVEVTSPITNYVVEIVQVASDGATVRGGTWARKENGRLVKLEQEMELEEAKEKSLIIEIGLLSVIDTLRNDNKIIVFYDQTFLDLNSWIHGEPELGKQIEKVSLDEEERLILHLKNGRPDLILDQTDLNISWQRWQYLEASWTENDWNEFTEIDLRFERPVGIKKGGSEELNLEAIVEVTE